MVTTTTQIIKQAQSREEIHNLFKDSGITLQERYYFVQGAIAQLNQETEEAILNNETDTAIFKMSQVVMLEDEIYAIERVILKSGVLV